MVNQKSIESYRQLVADGTMSTRQYQVLQCLKEELGMGTNKMIAKSLGWDINRVTGRVTELREKGLVVHAGDHYDEDTNRTVNLWKCI
jgi:DNA-binding MarR family transcriptional regulator|tara:strand:+ start:119 stop:382 length:264 start_codon:yes stop_codon:yes gene_type:complete